MATDLACEAASWLREAGPEGDVVISSRVRLARNLGGYPFLTRASERQQQEIEEAARKAIMEIEGADGLAYYPLLEVPEGRRTLFAERHLISREIVAAQHPCGVAFGPEENLAIMVNEEDHLRIQGLAAGFRLREAWEIVDAADTAIERGTAYAFDPQLGYLTACPTNVGTGIRVSVMVHLPALAMTSELQKVFNTAAKIDFVVRGTHGESSEAVGDFYQISNQKTLGRSEEEIIAKIETVIPQIVGYERRVRRTLLKESRRSLEDRVFRAYGLLQYARVVGAEEALNLLSHLRLGVNLEMLSDFSAEAVNPLFVLSQPAHLKLREQREMTEEEANAARADFLRQSLGNPGADRQPLGGGTE